jgi:predicted amidohydrolase
MNTFRIALANLPYPATPDDSVARAEQAISDASAASARLLCFPEGYVPGYRGLGHAPPPPDERFLERARAAIARAAARANITVVLGTERLVDGALRMSALVFGADGSTLGVQDKVQVDPSEDKTYSPACERRVFHAPPLVFGVSICHEGWRYPETVRWAARRGAQVVFHPHCHEAEAGSFRPQTFADSRNSFHEKAVLCRAAENTCYFASVNYASDGSPTTSAVANPDGTLLAYQPYGKEGLLVVDIDPGSRHGLARHATSIVALSPEP